MGFQGYQSFQSSQIIDASAPGLAVLTDPTVEDQLESLTLQRVSDFTSNTDSWAEFAGGVPTTDGTNLTITAAAGTQGAQWNIGSYMEVGRWYELTIVVESILTTKWRVQSRWGAGLTHQKTYLEVGVNSLRFQYETESPPVIVSTDVGGNVVISETRLTPAPMSDDDNFEVVIGSFAENTASGTQPDLWGVVIGRDAVADMNRSLVVGPEAKGVYDDTYDVGAPSSNQDHVALGWQAWAMRWRAVAVGPMAWAAAVSTLAVGTGAFCGTRHGVAIGRGAYVPEDAKDTGSGDKVKTVIGAATSNEDVSIYFGNTWANAFDTLDNGMTLGSTADPSSYRVVLHGWDAFDAKASSSETNVAGGHLQLVGGAGTGTASGGTVEIATCPAGGATNNTKNPKTVVAQFAATSDSSGSQLYLLDLGTSTIKKVHFGPNDSAGTGYKYLRVVN